MISVSSAFTDIGLISIFPYMMVYVPESGINDTPRV